MRWCAFAILIPLAAGCASVSVVPLETGEQFPNQEFDTIAEALAFDGALAFRAVTGFDIPAWDEVTITSDPGDDAAAWSCALTDGQQEFATFYGIGSSVKVPRGSYALTCDVIRAPGSSRMPVFSTRTTNVSWTACMEFGPVPPCVMARQPQKWAEFGDGLASIVEFKASVIYGSARLAALDVSSKPGCNVSVSIDAQGWVEIGSAVAGSDGMATVLLDTLVTITPAGVPMLLSTTGGCTIAVASQDPNPAVGDGAYGVGSPAFVGSLQSIHACSKATSSGRAVQVVTPSSTTAFVVRGWDPSTVARARVNLFARTTAQPRSLIAKVLSGMLAIPDMTYSAHTFVINNIQLSSELKQVDPTMGFWDDIRSAVALGLYNQGRGDPAFNLNKGLDKDLERLRDLVSLDLTNKYTFGDVNSIPVGVASSLPSISKFLRGAPSTVEWYLNQTLAAQGTKVITVSDSIPAMRVDVLLYARPSASLAVLKRIVSDQFMAYNATQQSDLISIGTVFTGPSSFLPPPALSIQPWINAAAGSGAWAVVVIGFAIRGHMLKNGVQLKWEQTKEA